MPSLDTSAAGSYLWAIILFPLVGAAVNGLAGRRLGRPNVTFVAIAAMVGSLLVSTIVFTYTPVEDPAVYENIFRPFTTHLAKCLDKKVVFYQVNLKLLDVQTNQIVWNGQKQIKKNVVRSAVTW